MGKIIAFANQKGGVGKTTSAVNIAACLGALGKKTLLVDSDPQGNATSGVGVAKRGSATLYQLLTGPGDVAGTVVQTRFPGLSLIPSSIDLAAAELELSALDARERRLKTLLDAVRDEYDYIVIDCPPSLGLLTVNALVASDGVVIPMQCEYFALEGLSQLTSTIKRVKELYNPSLKLIGILLTMYNGRLNLSLQVVDELKKYYSGRIFSTPIARSVRVSEAPSYGEPVIYYDKNSKGAMAYNDVTLELIQRA